MRKVTEACGAAFLVFVVLVWLHSTPTVKMQGPDKKAVLVLTETEQLHLSNLQLRKRALDAEYGQERLTADAIDEQRYASEVVAAHPGMRATFEFDQVVWIQQLGASGASGGTVQP